MAQQIRELVAKALVSPRGEVGGLELGDGRDERLGNEAAAVEAVVAPRVRIAAGRKKDS